MRLWKLDIGTIYRLIAGKAVPVAPDVFETVFIRYRHSNLNDLKHFYAFEVPPDEDNRIFEKSLGDDVSHLKLFQK